MHACIVSIGVIVCYKDKLYYIYVQAAMNSFSLLESQARILANPAMASHIRYNLTAGGPPPGKIGHLLDVSIIYFVRSFS